MAVDQDKTVPDRNTIMGSVCLYRRTNARAFPYFRQQAPPWGHSQRDLAAAAIAVAPVFSTTACSCAGPVFAALLMPTRPNTAPD
jgi:hypothetical protein